MTALREDPDLASYDVVLVNSSAGKDSQAMLDLVHERAVLAGVQDRVVVVHADVWRAEWDGTAELAEEQARRYSVRFVATSREQDDLLGYAERRRKWPSSGARWCTSEFKRAPVYKVMTALTREVLSKGAKRARILNCLGLRAQESPGRAKKPALSFDARASNGRRHVDTWLPVHSWTEEQVWERIRTSGIPHHRAYDLGMKRLSCVFCIFAGRDALLLAGRHNRPLLEEYVRVEREIGHTFKRHLPIAEILEAVDRGELPKGEASFEAGL